MVDNIYWLGHSSFRWDGSKILYFDPYKLIGKPKKADIIFISHEHYDHCSMDDIASISGKGTVIIASVDAARQITVAKVVCKDIKTAMPGDLIEMEGIKVKAVSAYNTNKNFHPKSTKKVGFIVMMDNLTLYHAGDTDLIPEMKDVKCDVALLPVGGVYTMTAEEAAQAASLIKPKRAIPMHYGEVTGTADDAKRFQRLLSGKIDVSILKNPSTCSGFLSRAQSRDKKEN